MSKVKSIKIYKISPILKYSPFFELTYVSKLDFKVGNIVEIDFNKQKIFGIVLEVYNLKDAKVEIRKSDFFTKKVETKLSKKEQDKFSKKQYESLLNFSHEFGIPIGEIIFYLFGADINLQNNPFEKITEFNFEKYVLLTTPHISRLHLYFVWLNNFTKTKQVTLQCNFLGVNEKYFLDNYKGVKIILEENKNRAKKYLVKVDGEEIINEEVLNKLGGTPGGSQAFVFVLEQAYASRVFCRDCKKSYDCENCGHAFSVLHEDGENFLYCKNCKNKKVLKRDQYLICKNCGSWQVFPFGTGVQKVKEFLKEKNIEAIVGSIKELNKFLDNKSKLKKMFYMTVVASLGPLVRGKNFDSDEKLIYLISKLENISKEIYINKREGDEISLENYKDKEKFVKEELIFRKQAGLPPFAKVVSLIFNYRNKKFVDKFIREDFEKFKISGEIKKGHNYIYYWFTLSTPSQGEGSDLYNFCKMLRNFGDVIVSNSIVEQSISSKK